MAAAEGEAEIERIKWENEQKIKAEKEEIEDRENEKAEK